MLLVAFGCQIKDHDRQIIERIGEDLDKYLIETDRPFEVFSYEMEGSVATALIFSNIPTFEFPKEAYELANIEDIVIINCRLVDEVDFKVFRSLKRIILESSSLMQPIFSIQSEHCRLLSVLDCEYDIDSLGSMPNLDSLFITYSGINSFRFTSDSKIRFMDLSNNRLTSVDSILKRTPQLNYLDISHNQIKEFDTTLFNGEILYLEGNPLMK